MSVRVYSCPIRRILSSRIRGHNEPDNQSPENLGQALRSERKHKGLSQKAVGALSRYGAAHHSKIEKGNPGTELNTLFRLLAALDLELSIQPRQKPSIESKGDLW